jgi:4-hydroxy-tetrahydrodipicolinate reductase
MTTTVAVVGASGRMGQLFSRLIEGSQDFELVASLRSTSPLDEMLAADIVVDVTVPAVSQGIVDFAIGHGKSVLVGTSGWSSTRITSLSNRLAAEGTGAGVIIIPNFSVGSVLATSFAAMAARFYDSIEIIEAHHATKVDSPSGTAVRTAELIGNARATLGPVIAPHADQRARGQQVSSVPIHSLRMQGIVARQDVIFGGTGETLTLSHETLDPSAYEAGIMLALRALRTTSGVVVGLDRLIDLGPPDPAPPADVPSDLE